MLRKIFCRKKFTQNFSYQLKSFFLIKLKKKYFKLNKECETTLLCYAKKIAKLIKKRKRNKNFEKQKGAGVELLGIVSKLI